MKQAIQQLIEQHKLHKAEAVEELNSPKDYSGAEFTSNL